MQILKSTFRYVLSAAALVLCSGALLAQEPAAQPTNMIFAQIRAYSVVTSFQVPNPAAAGYLIIKSTAPITFTPVDGTTYQKGQGVGNGAKVMYVGGNNILSVREILENTTYYFNVFAYNGSGAQINYKQDNPLSATVTSAAMNAGTYYDILNPSSANFLDDLHTLINNHTMVAYTSYRTNIVPAIFERDTTGGQVVINCEYSNETTVYTPPFDFNAQAYNREHTLAKSWMKTAALYGANNLVDYPEGADYYNLLLTRSTPNQQRSNRPLGDVTTTTGTYGESKYGPGTGGVSVFEPKADRKGDAARAMMYEMICYDGLEGGWGLDELLSEAGDQSQALLKQWHQQDPPDKFERTKNEYIASLQQNRNPFIDHPEWAECINFDSIFKAGVCAPLGVNNEVLNVVMNIYPNPAANEVNVFIQDIDIADAELAVYDMYGKQVYSKPVQQMLTTINTAEYAVGNYLLKIATDGKAVYKRLVIAR